MGGGGGYNGGGRRCCWVVAVMVEWWRCWRNSEFIFGGGGWGLWNAPVPTDFPRTQWPLAYQNIYIYMIIQPIQQWPPTDQYNIILYYIIVYIYIYAYTSGPQCTDVYYAPLAVGGGGGAAVAAVGDAAWCKR